MTVFTCWHYDGHGTFLFDVFGWGWYEDMHFIQVRFYHEAPAGIPYSVAIVKKYVDADYYFYEWEDPNTYETTCTECWEEVDISHSPVLGFYGDEDECYGVFIRYLWSDEWLGFWVDEQINVPLSSALILDLSRLEQGDHIDAEDVYYNSEGGYYGYPLGEFLIDVEVECLDYMTPTGKTTFSILKRLY